MFFRRQPEASTTMTSTAIAATDPIMISPTSETTPLLCQEIMSSSDNDNSPEPKMLFKTTPTSDPPSKTDIKKEYRDKQRRLLYMHHAILCQQSQCTVTTACATLKKLWNHAKTCRALQECKEEELCVWTRDLLMHYRTCRKGIECEYCGPARDEMTKMDRLDEFEKELKELTR